MIIVRNKVLKYKNFLYKCAIGKNGITNSKIEGDKCTPSGIYSIEKIYYREDKLNLPKIDFQTIPINKNFGWCDDILVHIIISLLNFLFHIVLKFYLEKMIYIILFVLLATIPIQ